MKNVDVQQLFNALEGASERQLGPMPNPYGGGSTVASSRYGFRTGAGAQISDDTIWYFYVSKPVHQEPYKICRFYPLAPYLDRGITVDDITTAIKTGSKMLGDEEGPSISFHKDTKLLIATGEPAKLEIIDSVLRALDSVKTVATGNFQERL